MTESRLMAVVLEQLDDAIKDACDVSPLAVTVAMRQIEQAMRAEVSGDRVDPCSTPTPDVTARIQNALIYQNGEVAKATIMVNGEPVEDGYLVHPGDVLGVKVREAREESTAEPIRFQNVYVITCNTLDFGDKYVCRVHVKLPHELDRPPVWDDQLDWRDVWRAMGGQLVGTEQHWVESSLTEARSRIPPGFERGPLHPADDPVVVEWWAQDISGPPRRN